MEFRNCAKHHLCTFDQGCGAGAVEPEPPHFARSRNFTAPAPVAAPGKQDKMGKSSIQNKSKIVLGLETIKMKVIYVE